ncbi:MAG TPA: C39 family peptidase [Methanospirillum sp.]|nr:C39 family peptidase [Methanospirillum sp.]
MVPMTSGKFDRIFPIVLIIILFAGIIHAEQPGGPVVYPDKGDHPGSRWYPDIMISDLIHDPNVIFIPLPAVQQMTDWTCGPASMVTLLRYYGYQGDERAIAEEIGSRPIYGSNVSAISGWFRARNWTVQDSLTGPDGDLIMLRENLMRGIPTMVGWADWGGHWQLVVGYDTIGTDQIDDDVIIFADSLDITDHDQDGYYVFSAERFYDMWVVPQFFLEDQSVRPWIVALPPGMNPSGPEFAYLNESLSV